MEQLILKKGIQNPTISLPAGYCADAEKFSAIIGVDVTKLSKDSFDEWFCVKHYNLTENGFNQFTLEVYGAPICVKEIIDGAIDRAITNLFAMSSNLEPREIG